MLHELFRYRALVKNLVLKDLKLKYRGSLLGVVWSLLHPMMLLAVYTVAFKLIVRIQMEHYPFFLLVGLLPWTFFAGSMQASTGAIVGNANLVKEVYFPREILPIATVLFNFAQFVLALAVFVPTLVLLSGVRAHWPALAVFPLVLLLHVLFTIGLAFVLSGLTIFFRDAVHLTEVALLLLFWLTPIIYPVRMVPPELWILFRVSPLANFAIAYQDVLFWGRVPEGPVLATMVAWTAAAVVGGYLMFRRWSPAFAEEV